VHGYTNEEKAHSGVQVFRQRANGFYAKKTKKTLVARHSQHVNISFNLTTHKVKVSVNN